MIRRTNRQRREYLYQKSQAQKDASHQDKSLRLKVHLDKGQRLPGDLRDERLLKDFVYDESRLDQNLDDEYWNSGTFEPRVLITTSREPSSKLMQFCKEMHHTIPNSQRVNRGNMVLQSISTLAKANAVTDVVLVHEHRGVPDGLIISHYPHGPTAYFTLHNVNLRHDLPSAPPISKVYPHLIFDNFSTKLGARLTSILKNIFPPIKPDAKNPRVLSFLNQNDYISFRHHVYVHTGKEQVELSEVGPRFEMRCWMVRSGVVEEEGETEWRWRGYTNTARKRTEL
ncbi:U3 small nucleolar ribonucleoprotein imp4 [Neolecta irregularis DAH-3]|uniref:U3 small nucleolar ribonucleoprotein protein IMP4 n=1 Tax=Neolecta irregularis (strain DAH-3) TaxID=1198029 RepID=A0A1U7LPC5_NEOID|nr:U3 small nucleolar ribonucleoprotein imp4 [Neolecta irregularis DAH-3]|eukprot:OLL24505.1 U3 small nucleolar ribonucleoprotein imp4 [Neolecta irregularis DAH-3]